MNIVRGKMDAKGKPLAAPSGCITGDCASCGHSAMCTGKTTVSEGKAIKSDKAKAVSAQKKTAEAKETAAVQNTEASAEKAE